MSGRLVNMKLKTFKMVSSLFGLAQIVKIKVTEEPRNEVSRKLCCFLELSFCSCKECWYIQNWKKDGGRPMFKYKTTKMIQGALIPFWWSGSRLVISSSWGDPEVIVGSFWKSLLLFRTPDATHHPLVSRGCDHSEQSTTKEPTKGCPKRINFIVSFDTS